ncbi:retrovirus-related pol polyprotein from transposon TNT 1-94 [Tanacetum coccineum]
MKDKVMPNNSQVKFKKTEIEDHHRISSISNKTKSVTACNDSLKFKTSNVNAVCATCGKCVFNSNHDVCVSKFIHDVNARTKKPKVVPISTVHFGNDQFAPILGYGDLVQGNITINRVYCVESLNHNLFSVGQFCDADLETSQLVSEPRGSRSRILQGFGDEFRRKEGKKIVLAAWSTRWRQQQAEVIATACYTQNRSIIIPTHEKTVYHIINDRKTSIRHPHIFGCTCYLTRDGENLDKMKEKRDSCILVGYSTQSKGYRVYNKRTRLIVESIHLRFDEIKEMSETSVSNNTLGLVLQRQKASDYDNSGLAPQLQNVSPSADITAPSQQELDLLFGPLYDEFFTACTSSVNKSSSPTDNSTQQDTQPTTNIQPTTEPTTPTNVNAEEYNDNQAADTQFQQDEFINPFCTPVQEIGESSSRNIDNSNMHTFYQPHDSEY